MRFLLVPILLAVASSAGSQPMGFRLARDSHFAVHTSDNLAYDALAAAAGFSAGAYVGYLIGSSLDQPLMDGDYVSREGFSYGLILGSLSTGISFLLVSDPGTALLSSLVSLASTSAFLVSVDHLNGKADVTAVHIVGGPIVAIGSAVLTLQLFE